MWRTSSNWSRFLALSTVNPDGRYYMDEDGYGMTDDEEIEIYGFIDQNAKIVVKFRNIKDNDELNAMRKGAEECVKQ